MAINSIADVNRLAYTGKAKVRTATDKNNDDWYTPKEWVQLARDVLGRIDLDPFSSELANEGSDGVEGVRAAKFYTQQDDALKQTWEANNVWMNPPYSRGLCAKACDKFIEEFEAKHFKTGIVLVNNMTDTQWFRRMAEKARFVVNLTGRIGFINAAGQRISGNTRGQTMFFFTRGDNHAANRFKKQMNIKGQIVWEKVK